MRSGGAWCGARCADRSPERAKRRMGRPRSNSLEGFRGLGRRSQGGGVGRTRVRRLRAEERVLKALKWDLIIERDLCSILLGLRVSVSRRVRGFRDSGSSGVFCQMGTVGVGHQHGRKERTF